MKQVLLLPLFILAAFTCHADPIDYSQCLPDDLSWGWAWLVMGDQNNVSVGAGSIDDDEYYLVGNNLDQHGDTATFLDSESCTNWKIDRSMPGAIFLVGASWAEQKKELEEFRCRHCAHFSGLYLEQEPSGFCYFPERVTQKWPKLRSPANRKVTGTAKIEGMSLVQLRNSALTEITITTAIDSFEVDRIEYQSVENGTGKKDLKANGFGKFIFQDACAICEKRGMRLPTRQEWLFMVSERWTRKWGGDFTARQWYQMEWLNDGLDVSLNKGPHQSGSLAPNGLGLYDLVGNRTEWLHDPDGGTYIAGEFDSWKEVYFDLIHMFKKSWDDFMLPMEGEALSYMRSGFRCLKSVRGDHGF